ncbi:site-specific DNA-methyltransferase [Celeribacter halophilus]|uniref:site-specific DNA-methyltransferase (adenine-specific) n=1 Tax=Celeribacter halophilus TaxID=576117 RepID=A0A1I3X1B8_9RHOB|nr:site-specific DNA-methyltransferase [Celeribacter halophilus]PZX03197.1 DNA modification methylase [Celeribacter halophilus]SFK12601.1 DNA modification methylase [Celeribacter halophilus]
MKIERVKTSELIPYARNARTHPEWQVAQIAKSITEFGFVNPVLVRGDSTIIAGHGRLMAAGKLGLDTVPVIRLDHLTDEQCRALVIADNKIAENSGWDEDLLREELAALQADAFDMDILGFSEDELDELLSGLEPDEEDDEPIGEEDEVPETDPIYTSAPGHIWILGDHRVMCGDSTSRVDVSALCDGGEVDACWTDPPYNVNYEGSAGKIQNDNMGDTDFRRFLVDAMACAYHVMRMGAPIYVAHADTEGLNFRRAFVDAGFKLSGCLIWEKPSLVLGRSDYQWRHEPILYGWKPGAAHSWYGDRNKTTVFNQDGEKIRIMPDNSIQIDMGDQVIVIEGEEMKMRTLDTSIIRHDKPAKNGDHPTMKPVSLVERMLENSTVPGDQVLDLFGGSGSTLIACHKGKRKARLMELDPKFCDVIVRRWQEYTGKAATLEGDGRTFDEIREAQCKAA